MTAAEQRHLTIPAAQDFRTVTGFGVTARVEGQEVLVGRPDLPARAWL